MEAEGIGFAPVRPDVGELLEDAALMEKILHPRRGSEYLLRYLLPEVANAYEDLNAACTGADLLVTHLAGYAGPIVTEMRKLPWVSIALQPEFFSRPTIRPYSPPRLGSGIFMA